jgi:hypothetical protein
MLDQIIGHQLTGSGETVGSSSHRDVSNTIRLAPVGGASVRLDLRQATEGQMKGIRHFLRNFTASAVKEHLRSELEATDRSPALTRNEIDLVRFIRDGSHDWDAFLTERSGA